MARLIDAKKAETQIKEALKQTNPYGMGLILRWIRSQPTVEAYTANEVAVILAELFGDTCACNFNGIDEWLPYKCELTDCCPNTYGVACWEQYLKYRNTKGGAEDGQ